MLKPVLVVTPHNLEDIAPLIEAGADAFIIGEEQFGLRLAGEFKGQMLNEAVSLIKSSNKLVYVAINAILTNENVTKLRAYLESISQLPIDGLRFSDPGAYMLAREVVPQFVLHWSSETLGTNFFTANYWNKLGVARTVLAPELMKDAVIQTKRESLGEIEILVHGAICMFQSRRELIGNYLKFQNQLVQVVKRREEGFELFDPERQLYYPIYEDCQGTHIFNGSDVCMIDDLIDFMEVGIDAIRIDGILKSSEYLQLVTKAYRQAIDLAVVDPTKYLAVGRQMVRTLESIQPNNRTLDHGFYYKPTMYKHK